MQNDTKKSDEGKEEVTHLGPFHNQFEYMVVNIGDSLSENISQHFKKVFDFIDNSFGSGKKGINVLVHCRAGASRSASFVIGYIMKHLNFSFKEAYSFVSKKRAIICPNENFQNQLKDFESSTLKKPIQE